jgi:hypothetical protein
MMSVAAFAIGVSSSPRIAVTGRPAGSIASAWATSVVVPERLMATTLS